MDKVQDPLPPPPNLIMMLIFPQGLWISPLINAQRMRTRSNYSSLFVYVCVCYHSTAYIGHLWQNERTNFCAKLRQVFN